jgi:hypothetical protein
MFSPERAVCIWLQGVCQGTQLFLPQPGMALQSPGGIKLYFHLAFYPYRFEAAPYRTTKNRQNSDYAV